MAFNLGYLLLVNLIASRKREHVRLVARHGVDEDAAAIGRDGDVGRTLDFLAAPARINL